MVARPASIPAARAAMSSALQRLNDQNKSVACQDRPVPFVEVQQTPAAAAELCGVGTPEECPLLELCKPLGFTESVYADNMVYGGLSWRRGLPLVSETGYQQVRGKRELPKTRLNKPA